MFLLSSLIRGGGPPPRRSARHDLAVDQPMDRSVDDPDVPIVPVEQPDDVLTSYLRSKRQVQKKKPPRPLRSERKKYKESTTEEDTLSDSGSTPSLDKSTSDEMTLQEIKQREQKKAKKTPEKDSPERGRSTEKKNDKF